MNDVFPPAELLNLFAYDTDDDEIQEDSIEIPPNGLLNLSESNADDPEIQEASI